KNSLGAKRSTHLAQLIHAVGHMNLDRLDRVGRHLGRKRADSAAWDVSVSNCFRQWAACNSTISARFLAPAKLLARLKQAFRFHWAMSMILRLNAAAPHPAASKDLSKVVIDASRASLERS